MNEAESRLCFVDSNVWLYAFIQTQAQDKTAKAKIIIQSSRIIVSSQVIKEVCVNLIKKAGLDEFSVRSLIESFYGKYQVALINQESLLKASELRDRYLFSYWDSLIVACALLEGATIVYSEDMQADLLVENRLQIINPFAV